MWADKKIYLTQKGRRELFYKFYPNKKGQECVPHPYTSEFDK